MNISNPEPSFNNFVNRLKASHFPLFLSGLFTVAMGLFFIVGLFFDPRYITGAPAWLKPTKFALSVSIYSLTLVWFLSYVDTTKPWRKRLVTLLGWIFVLTFAAEWLGIITQAVRGTTSHFNVSSPFNVFIWSLMGTAIMILFLANLVVAALLLRQRFANPVFAWGLRLGLIITIIGLAEGYLMTSPTAQQMAAWQAGGEVTIAGAHSVGVPDGGPGLPVLTWSTQGGDLRVGHFIGMHALQLIPFLALFLLNRKRLSTQQQVRLLFTGSSAYLALVILVTWQALKAQPITSPDSLTIAVFLGICLASIIAALVITRPRLSLARA